MSQGESDAGRARAEIAAIDRELEAAFDRILDAAEALGALAGGLPAAKGRAIETALTGILEAAAVRDIAGQRLSAVRDAIAGLESAASGTEGGPETNRDKSLEIEEKQEGVSASEDGLLNGPQLPGRAKDQQEVDALFDKLD